MIQKKQSEKKRMSEIFTYKYMSLDRVGNMWLKWVNWNFMLLYRVPFYWSTYAKQLRNYFESG